jgi:uncharacterized protein (TIGR03435 family)
MGPIAILDLDKAIGKATKSGSPPSVLTIFVICHSGVKENHRMTRAVARTILLIFANAAGYMQTAHGQTADHQPAFEVASIRPSAPYDPKVGRMVRSNGGPGTKDPTTFTCENCRLQSLIAMAFDIPEYRLSAGDRMGMDSFIVSAKIPAGATKEQFQRMMQNMLAERFKLVVHHEQKEMQTYDLVVAKGGLKLRERGEEPPAKEDAAEPDPKRPASTEGPKLGKDGFPTLPEGFTSAMMKGRARMMYPRQTMEWFAGMIAGQLGRPVIDATGLTGKYDFALFWAYGDGPAGRASTSDSTPLAAATDPEGPTLFEAIQSQLGLKLESKKGPVDIVVVDHAEKVPTEN